MILIKGYLQYLKVTDQNEEVKLPLYPGSYAFLIEDVSAQHIYHHKGLQYYKRSQDSNSRERPPESPSKHRSNIPVLQTKIKID